MRTVHIVVPDGIDDPARPSGGNAYDRRVCAGLAATGWDVREHAVPGTWPRPDSAAVQALTRVIAGAPDGAVVLVDGLIASGVPAVLVPEARRLRLVVLVHMPLGVGAAGRDASGGGGVAENEVAVARARERAVLGAARAVITTSSWTRKRLLDQYGLRSEDVQVAPPGVDPAALAPGTADGGALLCVAAVTPAKGHDRLLAALAPIQDRPWRCACVGPLHRDPAFVRHLRRRASADGIGDRIRFFGPRAGAELDHAFAAADALVLASRAETYGMVVTEALARGLPVVATAVGGLPEALGRTIDGRRPGLLVPPDDPPALTAALDRWLHDGDLRRRLRLAARERRGTLPGWPVTTDQIARVLTEVAT